jgi:hypothetical protein
MLIDTIIDKTIQKLKEEKEEKRGKVTARPGRGNIKSYIRKAKSRAESDPSGLMKDLGVTRSFIDQLDSKDFREIVVAVIRKAITYNIAMSEAFVGIRHLEGTDFASIKVNKIDSRDGIMFMSHMLKAAQKSELLRLDKDIKVARNGQDTVEINFIQIA